MNEVLSVEGGVPTWKLRECPKLQVPQVPQFGKKHTVQKEPDVECGSSSTCMGNGKSKLDTLSKDDLIKFAKKQMAAMQKLKSKCSDLEEKVEALKAGPGDSVIQELTERMDAVLLEKAETQQMLVLLRKENETLRKQSEESMETLAALQQKLEHSEKDDTEKIKLMEARIESTETKYREELEFFKNTAKENEEIQRRRLQEDFNSQIEAIRQEYESKISDLEGNLELAKKEWITEKETLKETHQNVLQKSQEDIENSQEMISQLKIQHEDEVRYLEEQLEINAAEFDMERERLLLVQEELSEQIALRESYLQDVQEEEEDLNRKTQKPSELIKALDSSMLEDPENEMDKLRLALQDLQSQNTMLKEELTFLTNVKTELEGDLQHLKEEFSVEREELEFKINELQMTKEEGEIYPEKEVHFLNAAETIRLEEHDRILHELKESHKAEMKELEACLISNNEREKEAMVQSAHDLQSTCKTLSEENRAIASEYEHTKEILRNIEMELGDRTSDFVKKYNAMKEQATVSIQELEEKLKEKDSVIEKLKCLEQTQDKSCNTSAKDLPVSNEEMAKLQEDHQSALKECDSLRKDLETKEEKLFKARKQVCYILSQIYSVKIDEEEDLSGLLNHLLSRAEEDKSIYTVLNEEKVKLQEELQAVSDERNDLKTLIETNERKHYDVQQQVCEILEQNYSVKIVREEDISVLLNHLLSSVQEEKRSCIILNEEKNKQQKDLVTVVQERDDLKRCMENLERKLSDAQNNVSNMLEQNYSVNIDKEEDISVLLRHLLSRVEEEKLTLTQQLEEREVQLSQQKQQAELGDEACLQTTSPNGVLSDTENLQEDQKQQGEITGSVMGQEHEEEPAGESCAQDTDDMKRLQQKLSEKESTITHLREEISHLQGKAKKELDNSKKEASRLKEELEALKTEKDKMSDSMKAIIHGAEAYKNLMIEYDKQTELLDKEKEKLEAAEKLVGDLTKRLHVAVEQHKQLSSERDDLMAHIETLQSNVRELEAQALEMHKHKSSIERDLEAERLLKEQKIKEHACAVKEVEELQILQQKQKQQLQQTEQELEQLRKDAQQSTLLDMEMADYERLVKDLNLQLSDKDRLLKEQERQAQTQREREERLNKEIGKCAHVYFKKTLCVAYIANTNMESLKSLVDIREEKTTKVKQLLVKTKKDLADAKKAEASQMILQSSLKGELEAIQQQLETYKIQCSELTADRHRLQEQLKSVSDQHQKSVTSYQHQVTTLQNDLTSTKAEFESTKSEFESYKVRVHNVLKQKKNKSNTESEGDFSKENRENMETMLDQLRSKLQESQLNAKSCDAELQQLQAEYDTLLERHNKMLQQTITKEAELRERLLSLHSENVALKSEHSQSVAQLTAQTETLRSSFREQLHHLQDEHRSTVETLQHQINSLETQLFQLQKDPATSGKGRELADMMERRQVDILCVQETRWKGSKARSIGAGFKLFYYGVDSKRNGVGVVLKEEFVRNVLEVGCELEEKERFWSELDEVMESIPTGERVVIGADFNGHVGEGNTGDEEKREEHRVTYKSGGRRTQIEKKTKWWKLKKEECCEEFRQKLRQALGGQVVLPDDWETTAEVIRETGRKVLGASSGRRKEDKETWWWNEEVQDSIQRNRLAKKKWDMDRTEENRQEYKELQRRVKREVSKAKQKAYEELYTRLDTREGEKDLYRLARQRDRDGKDVQQVRVIKNRDGRVLTSEESVQRRWKEYFEELMNEENEREKRVQGVNSVEQKVDKIRKDEVRKALKRMKSGKAVGPDDIPVEVWKCLGEAAVEFLASLFNRVLENLEKAYDRVPREELWYCMRKSGVAEKYVRVVQDMYERSRTVVRCAVGQTEEFNVEVGLHQGSALSPFLFAIVMDQLSEEVRQESPWTMMFADDIVICSESREQVNLRGGVSQQQSKKPQSDKKVTDLPLFEMNMAREEGEGMETTETESLSTPGTPPPSLEQLLTSPDPKREPFVWQVEPTKEELTNQLNTATRSMEHMNSLLHESEATNAILMEQINLLKSEMRRLERNQEREKSVANLEYLKNVLLQFIFLRAGSEKQALLPVIHTMLQLSPEEKSKLSAIAHAMTVKGPNFIAIAVLPLISLENQSN
ncbi:hypothetical protein QTP86_021366, partial [Hemibagrus guttatus]